MEQHEFIEQEVRRQVGRQVAAKNQEVAELEQTVFHLNQELAATKAALRQMAERPRYYGEVVKINIIPDASLFIPGEEILIIDESSPDYRKVGRILTPPSEQGYVSVQVGETSYFLSIGTHDYKQICLLNSKDGTYAVVSIDGKPWRVNYNFDVNAGDTVLIDPETKQIVGRDENILAGPICKVISTNEFGVEISEKHDNRIVANPKNLDVEVGDRVTVDSGYFILTSKLPPEKINRYKIDGNITVDWDQVGGLDEVKQQFREAIELPFTSSDLYNFYNVKKDPGILLYGPPGCGKGYLARAAATAMAKLHGRMPDGSGYYYVKSPAILDKWVGATEREISFLFEEGRRHFRKYGFPAILVFDEFEAIAPPRGTRRSSDITDTMVPMFLGEMDGVDEKQYRENPLVLLLTNRPDMIDQAVIRSGRISRHLKVERPNTDAAFDILKIHSENLVFENKNENHLQIMAITVQDIFSKGRMLYRVNGEYTFTFADAINGAILVAITEQAKMNAIRRNMNGCNRKGLILEDYRKAVQTIYEQQRGLNHTYDLQDFCEQKGIPAQEVRFERCYGNK